MLEPGIHTGLFLWGGWGGGGGGGGNRAHIKLAKTMCFLKILKPQWDIFIIFIIGHLRGGGGGGGT